jgi:polar amino acid transport system substrate-binding protein
MTRRLRRSPARAAALGIALALIAVACSQTDVPEDLPGPTTPTTPTTAAPNDEPTPGCSDNPGSPEVATRSLRPAPDGTDTVVGATAAIVERGYLRVGVDTSTRLWAFVEPATGEFVGFDIDIAKEISTALFGDASPEHLRFVAIPYSERVQVLSGEGQPNNEPQVDMVIDTFTINCRRDEQIDFSTEYFTATQKILVPTTMSSETTIETLNAEHTVCAPYGSTSIENASNPEIVGDDPPKVVGAHDHAECLVRLQQGTVDPVVGDSIDAITGDDTVLAGFIDQDPNVKVVGRGFSSEPYGIGVPPGQEDWLRFINAVLEDLRSSGRWVELYDRHLRDALGASDGPPPARYED